MLRLPVFLSALLVAGSIRLEAAVPRCDLASPLSNTGSCVDISSINGKTLQVPSNVTRISREGLALCVPKQTVKYSSDIIYLIDNSSSMGAWGYWVDASSGDTAWYTSGCSGTSTVDPPLLRPRHRVGTFGADSIGWDTVRHITGRNRPNCNEANDPYSMRAEAVRRALLTQAAFDSNSLAAVMQFSGTVEQSLPFRALNASGLSTLEQWTGLMHAGSGTNWYRPLDTAYRWFKATPTTRTQSIILISDGEPNQEVDQYRALVGQDGAPPVYAVYMGKSTDATPQLDFITSQTGGEKFVVPPSRPDSLQGVINSIVAMLSRQESVTSATIVNSTNGQASKSVAVLGDLTRQRLQLDSLVGLEPGLNTIRMVTLWRVGAETRRDTTTFVIDVSSATAPLGTSPLATSGLETRCYDPSRLDILDGSWSTVPFLTPDALKAGIRLTTSGVADPPLTVRVEDGAKDLETLQFSRLDSLAPSTWGRLLPLSVAASSPAIPGNQGLEIRYGLDTVRASWCHVRDRRDCAEAALETRSLRQALIRWVPDTATGPKGSMFLEAVLPGQVGNSVSVAVRRRNAALATVVLTRVGDSLFRASVPFVQGGTRRPGGDTLWLSNPPANHPDSLAALLVWGPTSLTLTDTALVLRKRPVLDLAWTGAGQVVAVALTDGPADARGERPVRISVGTRSRNLQSDPLNPLFVDVRNLMVGVSDSLAWVKGVFVDPVFGDSIFDSVQVPAPRAWVRFDPDSTFGPAGELPIEASIPGVVVATRVSIYRRGALLGTVNLLPSADSIHRGVLHFRQGPTRPSGDSLWIATPDPRRDTLRATLLYTVTGDTLDDSGFVVRPPLALDLTGNGTLVNVVLVGGQVDFRGSRSVDLLVSTTTRIVLDPASTASFDALSQLARVGGARALVFGTFVDPVYGDTARDTVSLAIPERSVRFVPDSVWGPRGALHLEVVDPWASGSQRTVTVTHGSESFSIVAIRGPAGSFLAEIPFTQASAAGLDTLVLRRPLAGTDSVFATLPRVDSLPQRVARVRVLRPPLSLVLVADSDRPQNIRIVLENGSADSRGNVAVAMDGSVAIPTTLLTGSGLSWRGKRDLALVLPESPDPTLVRASFVDPIYGDTIRTALQVVSPWFPSSITATPDHVDPRAEDTLVLRVRDRDPDSLKVGTVTVVVKSRTFVLTETGKGTGEYVLRLTARELDPDWGRHDPRKPWLLELVHVDPDHPRDVSRTNVVMEFDVPPADVGVREPIQTTATDIRSGKPVLDLGPLEKAPSNAQGITLKIWEKTHVSIFVYDNLGVYVGGWEGDLDPKDAETAAQYLVRWDGRDGLGQPVAPGIYPVRVLMTAKDGKHLGNQVFKLGRRGPNNSTRY